VYWVTQAATDRLQVEVRLPEGIAVTGSAGQMQQVAMNLVQNACDAAAEEAQPRLAIKARRVGATVEVTFRDNGPGIAPDNLPRLF
jgi:two-component system sensor histidine kinase HupT/HoxJ